MLCFPGLRNPPWSAPFNDCSVNNKFPWSCFKSLQGVCVIRGAPSFVTSLFKSQYQVLSFLPSFLSFIFFPLSFIFSLSACFLSFRLFSLFSFNNRTNKPWSASSSPQTHLPLQLNPFTTMGNSQAGELCPAFVSAAPGEQTPFYPLPASSPHPSVTTLPFSFLPLPRGSCKPQRASQHQNPTKKLLSFPSTAWPGEGGRERRGGRGGRRAEPWVKSKPRSRAREAVRSLQLLLGLLCSRGNPQRSPLHRGKEKGRDPAWKRCTPPRWEGRERGWGGDRKSVV